MTHPCPCGRPRVGSAVLCRACSADLHAHLAALPGLVDELEVHLSRQSRVAAPNPTTGAALGKRDGQPLPYDVGASDLLAGLRSFALSWVFTLAPSVLQPAQQPGGSGRLGPYTPRGALCALLAAEPVAREHPDAHELLTQARRAHARAVTVIDHPVHLVWLGPCRTALLDEHGVVVGECEGIVRAGVGEASGSCRACGALHDALERRRWLLEAAADNRLNVTQLGRQLAAYGLAATKATVERAVRRLVADDRLHAVGVDERGASTYRVGDVLDALATRRAYRRGSSATTTTTTTAITTNPITERRTA